MSKTWKNRQKCQKTGKRPSKIQRNLKNSIENVEKPGEKRQKCRKTIKISKNHEKTDNKILKNRQKFQITWSKPFKISKKRQKC